MKNNTRSITDFSQLIESLNESGIKNNVAVVWAEDNHTLDAVEMACKAGVITPILVWEIRDPFCQRPAGRFRKSSGTCAARKSRCPDERICEHRCITTRHT